MWVYHDDDEVEPAPCVGEVSLEAVRHKLEQHLKDEDDREDLVACVQYVLEDRSLLYVYVLQSLGVRNQGPA